MTDKPISEMTVEELLAYEACSYGKVTRVCQQDAAVNELARRATAGEAAAKELDDLRGADAAGWRDRCLKAEQRMGEAQLNAAEMMRQRDRLATAGEAAAKERDELRAKLRTIAQRIVEAIGADGPEDADHAVGRMIDKVAEVQQQRDRLAKVAGNAEQGDCLRGELGTVECPVDRPCGVCRLTRERDAALARVAAFEAQRDRRWQSVKGYLTKATDGMDWAQMIRHFAEAEKAALGKLAETEKQRDAALERERKLRAAAKHVMQSVRWRQEDKGFTFDTAPFCNAMGLLHLVLTAEPPKPPPADEPALARLTRAGFGDPANQLLRDAILELARRPR